MRWGVETEDVYYNSGKRKVVGQVTIFFSTQGYNLEALEFIIQGDFYNRVTKEYIMYLRGVYDSKNSAKDAVNSFLSDCGCKVIEDGHEIAFNR